MNASDITVTVPAYSVRVLNGVSTHFLASTAKFISYRSRIKSSKSSGIYFRVYVASANMISSVQSSLFSISSTDPGTTNHFCGEIGYSKLVCSSTINWNTSNKYKLFRFPLNPITTGNEYATTSLYKSPGSNYLAGNYGVIYRLTVNNTSGKYLWIEPDWTISTRSAATIIYRFNDGTWIPRNTPITSNGCWYLSMPTNASGNTELDIILPGGNHGNYWIYFS